MGGFYVGATEQNLLKLFRSLVGGGLSRIPAISNVSNSREKIIY